MTVMHPSSVNHRKRDPNEKKPAFGEKELYAFTEKRQNLSTGAPGASASTFLITTTRLDPMTYVLFGAYEIAVTERGLDCDGWLPIVGNIDGLDDIQRLKTLMEACMLRVFEGIVMGKRQRHWRDMISILPREAESDEDDGRNDYSLSSEEIKELDFLTRDIVRILNRYSEERIATQSRHNSRPGTPMDYSPTFASLKLPLVGSRSGHSTPYNMGSAYSSRPGTPSRLSRNSKF